MGRYDSIFKNVILPEMYYVKRAFPDDCIKDIKKEVVEITKKTVPLNEIFGKKIAVAVGSRGITNILILVKTTVDLLKEYGAEVFIVPAMGSQSGANAENQKTMLMHLGITEESVGAAICSTMETKIIGRTSNDEEVHFDAYAYEADYTVSIVRIKPHTSFRGKYESGIVKMNVIGLGNQKGADACHSLGMTEMGKSLERFGECSVPNSNLLYSLAVIENTYGKICVIDAILKKDVLVRDAELLEQARKYIPKFPVDNIDLLIVDEIGKNIAGTGMDSNIIQRYTSSAILSNKGPKRIAFLDLTNETFGAASGMGLADITTHRVFEKVDFYKTYPNAITSRTPMAVRMPLVMENDYDAIRAGLASCYNVDYDAPRVIRIRNTACMDKIWISKALLMEASTEKGIEISKYPKKWEFDHQGNLMDLSKFIPDDEV